MVQLPDYPPRRSATPATEQVLKEPGRAADNESGQCTRRPKAAARLGSNRESRQEARGGARRRVLRNLRSTGLKPEPDGDIAPLAAAYRGNGGAESARRRERPAKRQKPPHDRAMVAIPAVVREAVVPHPEVLIGAGVGQAAPAARAAHRDPAERVVGAMS